MCSGNSLKPNARQMSADSACVAVGACGVVCNSWRSLTLVAGSLGRCAARPSQMEAFRDAWARLHLQATEAMSTLQTVTSLLAERAAADPVGAGVSRGMAGYVFPHAL